MTLLAKRKRIERLWGVEFFDSYGMSECGYMAAECSRHDGMHIWADLFHLEVLDPDTWQPVAPGAVGVLVATPLYTNHATPFLRWVSGDIVTLTDGCDCGGPYGHLPLLHLTGRTSGFFKLRGVSINHNELEETLLALDDVSDYLVTALIEDDQEILRIEVETRTGTLEQDICTQVH
jgi:phenylacetate-CoA ligase